MTPGATNINDVERLVHRLFGIKGEARINLGRDLARDDLEDLFAKLNEKSVERGINFVV
jgi:hypothetical protein